jgi:hypothetical protein
VVYLVCPDSLRPRPRYRSSKEQLCFKIICLQIILSLRYLLLGQFPCISVSGSPCPSTGLKMAVRIFLIHRGSQYSSQSTTKILFFSNYPQGLTYHENLTIGAICDMLFTDIIRSLLRNALTEMSTMKQLLLQLSWAKTL